MTATNQLDVRKLRWSTPRKSSTWSIRRPNGGTEQSGWNSRQHGHRGWVCIGTSNIPKISKIPWIMVSPCSFVDVDLLYGLILNDIDSCFSSRRSGYDRWHVFWGWSRPMGFFLWTMNRAQPGYRFPSMAVAQNDLPTPTLDGSTPKTTNFCESSVPMDRLGCPILDLPHPCCVADTARS